MLIRREFKKYTLPGVSEWAAERVRKPLLDLAVLSVRTQCPEVWAYALEGPEFSTQSI